MVSKRNSDGTITLAVRGLGPLEDATVRLHPLTVFIGPNNVGKSYMASFIYAVITTFRRAPIWYMVEAIFDEPLERGSLDKLKLALEERRSENDLRRFSIPGSN